MSVEIEEKLEKKDVIGAFAVLKHWYRKFTGTSLKSSPGELGETRESYVKLFSADNLEDKLPFDFFMMANRWKILYLRKKRL